MSRLTMSAWAELQQGSDAFTVLGKNEITERYPACDSIYLLRYNTVLVFLRAG